MSARRARRGKHTAPTTTPMLPCAPDSRGAVVRRPARHVLCRLAPAAAAAVPAQRARTPRVCRAQVLKKAGYNSDKELKGSQAAMVVRAADLQLPSAPCADRTARAARCPRPLFRSNRTPATAGLLQARARQRPDAQRAAAAAPHARRRRTWLGHHAAPAPRRRRRRRARRVPRHGHGAAPPAHSGAPQPWQPATRRRRRGRRRRRRGAAALGGGGGSGRGAPRGAGRVAAQPGGAAGGGPGGGAAEGAAGGGAEAAVEGRGGARPPAAQRCARGGRKGPLASLCSRVFHGAGALEPLKKWRA